MKKIIFATILTAASAFAADSVSVQIDGVPAVDAGFCAYAAAKRGATVSSLLTGGVGFGQLIDQGISAAADSLAKDTTHIPANVRAEALSAQGIRDAANRIHAAGGDLSDFLKAAGGAVP